MKPPRDVSSIIKALNDNGFEAFLVGGCVRDHIMGKAPKDWDITTSATPQEVKSIFPHTYDTGIVHGTVTVVMNKINYEVTTYRIDGEYLDNRRPAQITFTTSLREDLLRRDFTMNSVAYHESFGFVDPFGGMEDIKARLVRGVGNPDKRFKEDGLRMLRAVRFASQLDFTIEPETWAALLDNVDLIKNISMERIRDEFLKLITSGAPKISQLCESGLISRIDPELNRHMQIPNPYLPKAENEVNMRLCVLLRGLERDEKKIIERLRFFKLDNKSIKFISTILTQLEAPLENDYYAIRKRINAIGSFNFHMLLTLLEIYENDNLELIEIRKKYLEISDKNQCVSMSMLALNGNDLKQLGVTNGFEIGRILNALLDHVLKFPDDNNIDILKNLYDKV